MTRAQFGVAELRRMKATAFLINTARGPIVSDAALYRGLKEGWIAGAAVDVIEGEPGKQRDWRPDNPLFTLPNFVVRPHAAYYSEEAMRTVRDFAAREVVRVLTGQPPLSPVNANQVASADRAWRPLAAGPGPREALASDGTRLPSERTGVSP